MYQLPQQVINYYSFYTYLKAFHIIAVVCWFAGLFYLPRLFVYHAMTNNDISKEHFKVMEHKLFWYIMTPAGVLSIISGEFLAHGFGFNGLWLHIKIIFVASLVFYHMYCFKLMDDFAKNCNTKTHKWFRFFNEYPTVVLIVCVVAVVCK